MQQNTLRQYGHVLKKDDEDWVKNVQLLRLTNKEEDLGKLGRIEDKDILDLELKPGDATDHSRQKAKIMQYWCSSNRQRCTGT